MSRYVFEGEKFQNCVVFSDKRFGEIRMMIDDDGTKLFAGIDIAACMGYAAPSKAILRSGIRGRMRMVPWVFKKKSGACDTRCFEEEDARQFIERGQALPEGFREWFYCEVLPQSRNIQLESDTRVKPGEEAKIAEYVVAELARKTDDISAYKDRTEILDSIVMEILMLKRKLAISGGKVV